MTRQRGPITVGVLALQGAFNEHIQLLRLAGQQTASDGDAAAQPAWNFLEVRTPEQLAQCDALILPGGESTAIALLAIRGGLLEPLRDFVKVYRRPTWGTCAGLILLSESANRTKKGGQELIGGLDVRTNRNHFGRQNESFQADLDLSSMLVEAHSQRDTRPFKAVFIRAPVVERVLTKKVGEQSEEAARAETIVAPSRLPVDETAQKATSEKVEVLARLPRSSDANGSGEVHDGDIVAVKQGNVFGTSFHPELTGDPRIHSWWLQQVLEAL